MVKFIDIKIGDVCRIKHGYAFKSEYFSNKGKYLVLTPGNFKAEGGIRIPEGKAKYYSNDFPKEYILKKGDIVVVMTDILQSSPILGSPGIIKDDNRFLHNQRLGKVKDIKTESMLPEFLYWIFNSRIFRETIKGSATGATVKHTAPERIYAVKVKIPKSEGIQKKIASVLSAYDDLIDVNERKIKILEDMAKLIYKEWFVKFRFPGYERAKMVKSELGKIPEGWQVRRLGEVCNILMGQSPRSEFYNEEGVGLPFHQGVTYFGNRFPKHQKYCTVNKRIANERDILFSVRAPVGRINIADKRLIIGRGLAALANKNSLNSFQFYQLKNLFEEEDILGGGTVFKSVTKNDMHNIKVMVPVFKIARRFNDIVLPIDNQIKTVFPQVQNLRHTRDMLLLKLISGKVDVSGLNKKRRGAKILK